MDRSANHLIVSLVSHDASHDPPVGLEDVGKDEGWLKVHPG